MSYKETEAYKAHQKIGFPKIDDEVQLEMLTTLNYQPIMDLNPEIETFSFSLLNEYITVSKKQLKEYIRRTNIVDYQLKSFSPTCDGLWLQKIGEKYMFFERERGQEFNHISLNGIDEVLNHYTNLWEFGVNNAYNIK